MLILLQCHADGFKAFRQILKQQGLWQFILLGGMRRSGCGCNIVEVSESVASTYIPPLLGNLMDDISTGLVHYRFTLRKGNAEVRLDTYTQSLEKHGHTHEWMGFLDADEVTSAPMHR